MSDTRPPVRAAIETVLAHGITPDRCEILQDANTLVLRLSETLVVRVVQDLDGPRQGTEWFARENAIAAHLTREGAPVIPLHPDLPPGPHLHLGYPLNFWQFVTRIEADPDPFEVGQKLSECHAVLSRFTEPLPALAIITESAALLKTLEERKLLPVETLEMLAGHLHRSIKTLSAFPHQPLHGDAHLGNVMNTTIGLLWTDWEDAFSGPVEWDVASVIWNAQILEEDHETVERILSGYRSAGGQINEEAMQQCLIARAAVVCAWYPILYPDPDADRQSKMQRRLNWLGSLAA